MVSYEAPIINILDATAKSTDAPLGTPESAKSAVGTSSPAAAIDTYEAPLMGAQAHGAHAAARSPNLVSTVSLRRKAFLVPLSPSSLPVDSLSTPHSNTSHNNNGRSDHPLRTSNLLILSGGSSAITNSRRVSTIRSSGEGGDIDAALRLENTESAAAVVGGGSRNKSLLAISSEQQAPSSYIQKGGGDDHNQAVLSRIIRSKNAEGNPLAAIANTIAVDHKMRTISAALAITSANPVEEAQRFADNCNLGAAPHQQGGGQQATSAATTASFHMYYPFGRSVDVSSEDLARVTSVGAYALIDEESRCPHRFAALGSSSVSSSRPAQEHDSHVAATTHTTASFYSPRMATDKRYQCVVPPHHLRALSPEDPFYSYETAEQMLDASNACDGSLWASASEQFERAAQSFATLGLFRMAANSQIRQYDCFKAMGQKDDAAQCLIAASHYYTQEALVDDTSSHKEASEAALASMQNAIGVYDDQGMDVTAAKICAEAAELCVKARNAGLGVDILHVAAGTFEAAEQLSHAERCYARAAEIAILDMRDFADAIDTLEKMAKVTSLSRQHMAYFKAFICRFVCVPPEQGIPFVVAMEDCEKTLRLYEELCPALVGAPEEYGLIKEMMASQKKMEDERLETAIGKYLATYGADLERWAELILRKIHENLVSRKASVEKLYKL